MLLRLPTNRFVRHLLFWMLVCLCFVGLQGGMPLILFGTPPTDVSTYWVRDWDLFVGVQLPVMLGYSYGVAYILLPFVLRRQYGRFFLGLAVLIALIWLLFALLLLLSLVMPRLILQPTLVYETAKQLFAHRPIMLDFMGSPFFRINIAAGLMAGTKLFNQWYEKQQESQRLENQKLQTQIKLLKLQLNPDFLFDSLNRLHQLTQHQPKQAPEVVLKLAHLLRYILYESQADRVPLARETEVIEQYVFLQRVMHPSGLEVSLTIRGSLNNQTIVLLLLFSIVETAFSQLPAEPRTGEPAWVSIDVAIGETQLTLKVINGQAINQPDNSVWLVDVQKQLYFYYAGTFDLQVRSEPDMRIISLTLPLPVSPQANVSTTEPLPGKDIIPSVAKLL